MVIFLSPIPGGSLRRLRDTFLPLETNYRGGGGELGPAASLACFLRRRGLSEGGWSMAQAARPGPKDLEVQKEPHHARAPRWGQGSAGGNQGQAPPWGLGCPVVQDCRAPSLPWQQPS